MVEREVGAERSIMHEAIQDALDHALLYGDDVTAFDLATIMRGAASGIPAALPPPLRLGCAA